MFRPTFIAALITISTAATAQQQPPLSNDDLMSIIQTLEGQRNQAQTSHAMAEARATALAKENARLKAELEELKKAQVAQSPSKP